jgi:hypothetical protein
MSVTFTGAISFAGSMAIAIGCSFTCNWMKKGKEAVTLNKKLNAVESYFQSYI